MPKEKDKLIETIKRMTAVINAAKATKTLPSTKL